MRVTTPQPSALIDAAHRRIERLQRTLAHRPHGDLTTLVATLGERVDALSAALLADEHSGASAHRASAACVVSLGDACAAVEGALSEGELPGVLVRSLVSALEACADLALCAMERPHEKPARVA